MRDYIPMQQGGVVERDAFGSVRLDRNESRDGRLYKPYREALRDAREHQPGSPENPEKAFARDLRIEIIDTLGIEDPAEYKRVRMYTAVGSIFDRKHGVDAFVEVDMKTGTVTVTLDITTRTKLEWKADICIQFPPDNLDPDLDEKEYLSMIEKVAQAVVRKVQDERCGPQYISP